MEKLLVILLLILVRKGEGGKFKFMNNYFLLIDRGVTSEIIQVHNNQSWWADSFFIDSGKTSEIPFEKEDDVPPFFTTLRYFPQQRQLICFDLPLTKEKFLFRAGFYYANYDGKSQPPVFDLTLGGQLWATVNSSSTKSPIFHELMYTPMHGNISVCLSADKDGGDPFISSLEATYLDRDDYVNQTVYTKMNNGTAYHLVSRINFGDYHKIIEPWSHYHDDCEERMNRYWMPQQMAGYTNLKFEENDDIMCVGAYHENEPPNSLLNTAITPQHASQSIHIPVVFPTSEPQTAYIVLYFYQYLNDSETLNPARYMDIYVDGVVRGNVRLEKYTSTEVMTLYPLKVQGTANVTISPAKGTELPPLINGMEVFTATRMTEEASYGYKISSSLMLIWVFQFFVMFFVLYK